VSCKHRGCPYCEQKMAPPMTLQDLRAELATLDRPAVSVHLNPWSVVVGTGEAWGRMTYISEIEDIDAAVRDALRQAKEGKT